MEHFNFHCLSKCGPWQMLVILEYFIHPKGKWKRDNPHFADFQYLKKNPVLFQRGKMTRNKSTTTKVHKVQLDLKQSHLTIHYI